MLKRLALASLFNNTDAVLSVQGKTRKVNLNFDNILASESDQTQFRSVQESVSIIQDIPGASNRPVRDA